MRMKQVGPAGDWDGQDADHAAWISMLLTVAAAQYLDGIASLLSSRDVFLPIAPIVRSVMEIAGRIAWLLDPSVRPRDRAARVNLLRLESLTRGKTTAYSLGHADAYKWGDDLRAFKVEVLPSKFYPSEIDWPGGRLLLREQRLPRFRDTQSIMEEVHDESWRAAGHYDVISDLTHPTFHMILQLMSQGPVDPTDVSSPSEWVFALDDASYPWNLGRNAAVSFLNTWALSSWYIGAPSSEAEQLLKEASEHVAPGDEPDAPPS